MNNILSNKKLLYTMKEITLNLAGTEKEDIEVSVLNSGILEVKVLKDRYYPWYINKYEYDIDSITSNYRNGLLKINIPKKPNPPPIKITID